MTDIYAPKLKDLLVAEARKKILSRVISGGQTGVDIAALQAANHAGIVSGGTAPKGFKTELGFQLRLLQSYGLVEHTNEDYAARTLQNVLDGDMTLLIGSMTGGTKATAEMCLRLKRRRHFVSLDDLKREGAIDKAYDRILSARRGFGRALVLNVAGNRESKSPGIEYAAEEFLIQLFQKIKDAESI